MAEAIFVKKGGARNYTPGADVAAGDVVVLASILIAVAREPILSGVLGTVHTDGIYDVLQAAMTFADGQAVYWDVNGTPVGGSTTGAAVESSAEGPFMGFAIGATVGTDLTVRVELRSVESSAAETLGLADLDDIASTAYTGGSILIADNTSLYVETAVSGDGTLTAAGVLAVTSFATMPTIPSATVAALGSDQTDAAAVTTGFTLVTAADATKGVILPTAVAGSVCHIKNIDAANAVLKIYPFASDGINALTVTTGSLDIAAKTSVTLIAYDATTWYSFPLLPS